MAFAFPDWTEDFLVADAAFAAAYDACASEERAALKTAIARTATVCGVAGDVSHRVRVMRQGFSLREISCPASWTILVLDGVQTGPARMLAALMPAILAGVPDILVCRVVRDSTPFPQGLLAALELAGQERVMECGPEDALALVSSCCKQDARGRLILLGRDDVFAEVARMAAERDTPLLRYGAAVRIGIAASSFATPVPDAGLCFAHPDATQVRVDGDIAQGGFSAVFCAETAVQQYLGTVSLVLSPGNEAYWVWPGLSRDFFTETVQGVSNGDATISAL